MFDFMEYTEARGHEQVVYHHDKASGLRAIIAVHDTRLGPGLGGTRLWRYDRPQDALLDVLRLSEGMTYKAAVAGLPLGGGKAVILADGQERDPQIRAQRFRAYGRLVDSLGGRYITAEDVGTQTADMVEIHRATRHVVGLPEEQGGSGDPSPMTAFGVLQGMRAAVKDTLGRDHLHGVHVAVQGLGKVGYALARYLIQDGARVTATDIRDEVLQQAKRELGVEIVPQDAIYDVACDVFAPCALGAVINDDTIGRLRCRIVAGSANNQLEDLKRHSEALQQMGIVYAVDYVVNAGGIINVYCEVDGYDAARARQRTAGIYDTVMRMLALARQEGITTQAASERMAQEALQKAAPVPEAM